MESGPQEVLFDASRSASGVYFYRLTLDGDREDQEDGGGNAPLHHSLIRKMVLIK
jgi:hypothetical protein